MLACRPYPLIFLCFEKYRYLTPSFERPDFERLMDDVRSRKIDCIVVKDLSRFGRNYKETGNYLERIFPYLDVRFIAVNDSFDTLTAERTADGYIVPLKNIINEVYSKDIGRKSRSALVTKQQKGEFIGAWAAYGYQKCASDPHRIEPDQETAPVVREIFALRLTGISYQQIARKLNEREVPSPGRYLCLKGIAKCPSYANSRWTVAAVKKVLTSKVYLGHMVQGRKTSWFSPPRPCWPRPTRSPRACSSCWAKSRISLPLRGSQTHRRKGSGLRPAPWFSPDRKTR